MSGVEFVKEYGGGYRRILVGRKLLNVLPLTALQSEVSQSIPGGRFVAGPVTKKA